MNNKLLVDKFGRKTDYLRLSLTDRCNLRCLYCMPERGEKFLPKDRLLSFEQILYVIDILTTCGIKKIRLTGGEPFIRSDIDVFLKKLSQKKELQYIGITSNLTLIKPYVPLLESLNIKNINVSLDCVDRKKFLEITRKDQFDLVLEALMELIQKDFNVKINCVVMKGINEDQIVPLLSLAKEYPVNVRFLEEMPFNGNNDVPKRKYVGYKDILDYIKQHYDFSLLPLPMDEKYSTSQNYTIEGFKGNFGVIPSYSRTFCGSCNRLRLSASGNIRTCLYGSGQLNIKKLLDENREKEYIVNELMNVVAMKSKDGFVAERQNKKSYLSMVKLGG